MLPDAIHGFRAAFFRYRVRRHAERTILALAVELRDVIRTQGHPRRQTNAINDMCAAVDDWAREGGKP